MFIVVYVRSNGRLHQPKGNIALAEMPSSAGSTLRIKRSSSQLVPSNSGVLRRVVLRVYDMITSTLHIGLKIAVRRLVLAVTAVCGEQSNGIQPNRIGRTIQRQRSNYLQQRLNRPLHSESSHRPCLPMKPWLTVVQRLIIPIGLLATYLTRMLCRARG